MSEKLFLSAVVKFLDQRFGYRPSEAQMQVLKSISKETQRTWKNSGRSAAEVEAIAGVQFMFVQLDALTGASPSTKAFIEKHSDNIASVIKAFPGIADGARQKLNTIRFKHGLGELSAENEFLAVKVVSSSALAIRYEDTDYPNRDAHAKRTNPRYDPAATLRDQRRTWPALTLLIVSIIIGSISYYFFRLSPADMSVAIHEDASSVAAWGLLYFAAVLVSWVCIVILLLRLVRFVFGLVARSVATHGPEIISSTVETGRQLGSDLADVIAKFDDGPRRRTLLEEAYAAAANEIENGVIQKGLWAKAFADSEGDEQKQKALYVKYRAEQIVRSASQ